MTDFDVPQEWLQLADRIDRAAVLVRGLMDTNPAPWPNSVFAREKAAESDYAALPYDHPATHVGLMPLQFLGAAQDHLLAFAALVRAPRVVMAPMTVLRTQLIAAGLARFVGDPSIGQLERCRRAMNCDLKSRTEVMRALEGNPEPTVKADFEAASSRRLEIEKAGRTAGFIAGTVGRKGAVIKEVYLGGRPPTDMELIDRLLASPLEDGVGNSVFRQLSATAHAQLHGFSAFIQSDSIVEKREGYSIVRVGSDGRDIMVLTILALGGMHAALQACALFYGWNTAEWSATVGPLIHGFLAQVTN